VIAQTRLVAPTGGRFWWAGLAAAWTASTLSAAPMVDGDPTLLFDLGALRTAHVSAAALAKGISVAASAAALVMIGALARPSATSRRHVLLGLAIVLAFAAPTSVLWLQDGTSTGVLVAAAVACGVALDRWLGDAPASERVLVLGVAAALPAVLSLDAAPLGIATLLAARALDRTTWWPAVATAAAIAVPIVAATHLDIGLGPGLAPLGIFALIPVVIAVFTASGIREFLPTLAFAAAVALVYERHSGALARRLEHVAPRRAWRLALAVGVLHVAVTWQPVRARFTAAPVPHAEATPVRIPHEGVATLPP